MRFENINQSRRQRLLPNPDPSPRSDPVQNRKDTHLRREGHDLRRAEILRRVVGPEALIMLDANQHWTLPQAIEACRSLACISPYWIEEPTHPDDVFAHQTLAREIAPIPLALGEHVSNRVLFKNYLQANCVGFVQVDCTRVGGEQAVPAIDKSFL